MSNQDSLPFDDNMEPKDEGTHVNGRVLPPGRGRTSDSAIQYSSEHERDDFSDGDLELLEPPMRTTSMLTDDYGDTLADLDEFDEFADSTGGQAYVGRAAYDEFDEFADDDADDWFLDEFDEDLRDDEVDLYDEFYASELDDLEVQRPRQRRRHSDQRRRPTRRKRRTTIPSSRQKARPRAQRRTPHDPSSQRSQRNHLSTDTSTQPKRKLASANHNSDASLTNRQATGSDELMHWLAQQAMRTHDPAIVTTLIAPLPALALAAQPAAQAALRPMLPILIRKVTQLALQMHRRRAIRGQIAQLPRLVRHVVAKLVKHADRDQHITPKVVAAVLGRAVQSISTGSTRRLNRLGHAHEADWRDDEEPF